MMSIWPEDVTLLIWLEDITESIWLDDVEISKWLKTSDWLDGKARLIWLVEYSFSVDKDVYKASAWLCVSKTEDDFSGKWTASDVERLSNLLANETPDKLERRMSCVEKISDELGVIEKYSVSTSEGSIFEETLSSTDTGIWPLGDDIMIASVDNIDDKFSLVALRTYDDVEYDDGDLFPMFDSWDVDEIEWTMLDEVSKIKLEVTPSVERITLDEVSMDSVGVNCSNDVRDVSGVFGRNWVDMTETVGDFDIITEEYWDNVELIEPGGNDDKFIGGKYDDVIMLLIIGICDPGLVSSTVKK